MFDIDEKLKLKLFPYIADKRRIHQLKIDQESLIYITINSSAELMTRIIISHCYKLKIDWSKASITDATAGVGGNTLSFAKIFGKITSFEINVLRYSYLCNNVSVYGFTNVSIHNDDYIHHYCKLKQEILFLDPPWGGKDYKKQDKIQLYISGKNIERIIHTIIKKNKYNHCKLIAIKIPDNFDIVNFFDNLYTLVPRIYYYKLKKISFIILELISV